VFLLQIASLLKDNERIQSTQTVTPNDEDSDIKKIKKVCTIFLAGLFRKPAQGCERL
jgi:Ras-specific guanine nucleotide-releasing factor 1